MAVEPSTQEPGKTSFVTTFLPARTRLAVLLGSSVSAKQVKPCIAASGKKASCDWFLLVRDGNKPVFAWTIVPQQVIKRWNLWHSRRPGRYRLGDPVIKNTIRPRS